ncbi:hypothetical protein N7470_008410 [Penicillium chermesinum]|nr:hypothetical protein N7470_008410 [Penicillium chermesinum]
MPRTDKAPIKAACLACRSSKIRCDGQKPCEPCSNRDRECSYQPSRRGGPRRGARYAEVLKRRSMSNNLLASEDQPMQQDPSPDLPEDLDPALDSLINLLAPYSGIHSLDLSPDALPNTGGAIQLWGQLTPDNDGTFTTTSADEVQPAIIRAYQSEKDILNAYYIFIHPYFPLLPPPLELQTNDEPTIVQISTDPEDPKQSDLPYWPATPLSLALSAILVLVPPNPDIFPITNAGIILRRSWAQMFAQEALSHVERELDLCIPESLSSMMDGQDQLHSKVPRPVNSVLALTALSIYEYCQRGNASRMRARINQAYTTAVDMSLHDLGPNSSEFSEAKRRAWWMIVFMQYLSSSVFSVPPMVFADDPRITTPFPKFGVQFEPWAYLMKAFVILYDSGKMTKKIEQVTTAEPFPNFGSEIKEFDSIVVALMMEVDHALREAFDHLGESPIAHNILRLSRILVYT